MVLNTNPNHPSRTEFDNGRMQLDPAVTGKELVDVLSGSKANVGGDGTLSLEVPARRGAILVPRDQVK